MEMVLGDFGEASSAASNDNVASFLPDQTAGKLHLGNNFDPVRVLRPTDVECSENVDGSNPNTCVGQKPAYADSGERVSFGQRDIVNGVPTTVTEECGIWKSLTTLRSESVGVEYIRVAVDLVI